jgi:MFS family permease
VTDSFRGVNYYLSCWYRRSEFGIRAAIFFSAAALAGSFGGLLAAAIVNMEGIGGKPGWAWIFILEGLATIVIAFASFWMVWCYLSKAHVQRPHLMFYRFMISPMRPSSSPRMTVAEFSAD